MNFESSTTILLCLALMAQHLSPHVLPCRTWRQRYPAAGMVLRPQGSGLRAHSTGRSTAQGSLVAALASSPPEDMDGTPAVAALVLPARGQATDMDIDAR